VAAIAIAMVVVGWLIVGRGEREAVEGSKELAGSQGNNRPGARLSSEAVLAIAPGVARQSPAKPKYVRSVLSEEVAVAKAWKPIFERLRAKTGRTAEEDRFLGEILERCAKIAGRKDDQVTRYVMGTEESKQRFIASLSQKDPNRDKRIAAFDKINIDVCEGLKSVDTTETEIRALYESAGRGGNLVGRVRAINYDIENSAKRPDGSADWFRRSITDSQIEDLKQILASEDPRAFVEAARIMLWPLSNLSLRAGPNELPIDSSAFIGAAMLLGCDLGEQCDTSSRNMMSACAMRGLCDSADYRDYLFFYQQNPHSSQLTGEYYSALQRARSGDWSYFTFHRGPAPSIAPYVPAP
jgi:hypothetical protein